VRLRVNLTEFFGGKVPQNNAFREAVGQAIIDAMLTRTEQSVDVNGKSFTKYSKEYKGSLDFDAAGKSNKVNLRLTGDMLDQIDVTKIDGNTIEIGWDDSDESAKAHGHITGGGNMPKRDFFGINGSEKSEIRGEFSSALNSFRDKERAAFNEKVAALLTKFKEATDGEENN